MADLTDRAEEALLGALINDASQAAEILAQIDASAFTDPARRSVRAEIARLSDLAAGISGPDFADLILAATDEPAITSDYLTRLALSPPTPDAAHVYARLVAEASLTRALTSTQGEAEEGGPDAGPPSARPGAGYSASLAAARSALGNDQPAGAAPAGERVHSEEQFLAGVIGHQELTDWIRLDPATFTSPGLDVIYQATLAIERLGEPIDQLTLAWRTAGIIAQRDYADGRATTAEAVADAIPPGTITRLISANVDPVTALEAGRDLLADHARAQLAAESAGHRRPATHDRASRRHALAGHESPLLPLRQAPELERGRRLSQEGM